MKWQIVQIQYLKLFNLEMAISIAPRIRLSWEIWTGDFCLPGFFPIFKVWSQGFLICLQSKFSLQQHNAREPNQFHKYSWTNSFCFLWLWFRKKIKYSSLFVYNLQPKKKTLLNKIIWHLTRGAPWYSSYHHWHSKVQWFECS